MPNTSGVSGWAERAKARVMVVADVRLYRDGLSAVLGATGRFEMLDGQPAASAVECVRQCQPAVVIVDMSAAQAPEVIHQIRTADALVRVIAFGIEDSIAAILDVASAGAMGYVTVDASVIGLCEAIDAVAAGELHCHPRISWELFQHLGSSSPTSSAARSLALLTLRQRQILDLIRRGSTNKDIANTLHLSEATVKNHVHQILTRLGVASRTAAAGRSVLSTGSP